MKKSTIILLLLFLASGAATVWYLNQPEEKSTTLYEKDSDFKITDTDQIGKIFLASRIRGTQFLLERRDDEWFVQDTFKVNPKVMVTLLQAIRTMKIKYRPAEAAIPNITKSLAVDQVKAEIYDREGKLMKAYYVGGETNDARGTYVIMENSEKPFVMEVGGMTGSFKVRYDLGLLDLRDRALYRENPEDIEYVSIEYPKQKNKSFILDRSSGKDVVTPFYPTTPVINKSVAAGSADRYVQGYEEIIAEVLVSNREKEAAFDSTIPFCTIKLRRKNGTERNIIFYPKDATQVMTGETTSLIEKFAASVDGEYEVMYVAQLSPTQKLFTSYENFF